MPSRQQPELLGPTVVAVARRVEILNSNERGTPKHEATLNRLARRGVEDVLAHCDAMEAQGYDRISIDWLRARLTRG